MSHLISRWKPQSSLIPFVKFSNKFFHFVVLLPSQSEPQCICRLGSVYLPGAIFVYTRSRDWPPFSIDLTGMLSYEIGLKKDDRWKKGKWNILLMLIICDLFINLLEHNNYSALDIILIALIISIARILFYYFYNNLIVTTRYHPSMYSLSSSYIL